MSHVVSIRTQVDDLRALAEAAAECGLEFREGQKTYKWYGRHGDYPMPEGFTAADLGKCAHAIGVPGRPNAYEIGVVPSKTEEGKFELLFDFWNGGYGLMDKAGKDCQNLLQEYSVAKVRRVAGPRRRVRKQKLDNGKIRLMVART